jgi:hypothetical protein
MHGWHRRVELPLIIYSRDSKSMRNILLVTGAKTQMKNAQCSGPSHNLLPPMGRKRESYRDLLTWIKEHPGISCADKFGRLHLGLTAPSSWSAGSLFCRSDPYMLVSLMLKESHISRQDYLQFERAQSSKLGHRFNGRDHVSSSSRSSRTDRAPAYQLPKLPVYSRGKSSLFFSLPLIDIRPATHLG